MAFELILVLFILNMIVVFIIFFGLVLLLIFMVFFRHFVFFDQLNSLLELALSKALLISFVFLLYLNLLNCIMY